MVRWTARARHVGCVLVDAAALTFGGAFFGLVLFAAWRVLR